MKKLLLLLVLIGVALVGVACWLGPRAHGPTEDEYGFISLDRGEMAETISASGFLQPKEVAVVTSELPSEVVVIHDCGEFNRTVEKGQALVELDKSVAQRRLDQARAGVEMARTDVVRAEAARDGARIGLEKQQELQEKQIGFEKDVIRAEKELQAAEAGLRATQLRVKQAEDECKLAEVGLAKTTLRAPIAGTIIDKKVHLGQVLSPLNPTPLFTLARDLREMQVLAQIAEGDVGKVRVGLKASFTVNAYSEDEDRFEGQVVQVRAVPTSVQGAVFYTAVIETKNQRDPQIDAWKLRPGMPASVDIVRRTRPNVWRVPTVALNFQLEEPYQSEAVKAKLALWRKRKEAHDWKPVWVLDAGKKPWPIFVRIGGKNDKNETGIKDSLYNEVLEWEDPEGPKPARVIISAPAVSKPGFLDRQANKMTFF